MYHSFPIYIQEEYLMICELLFGKKINLREHVIVMEGREKEK